MADNPEPPVNPAPTADPKAPVAPPQSTEKKQELDQTSEELSFYAPNHICLTILAVIFFPPLGIIAVIFCYKTWKANKESRWEDAYVNSGQTGWLDVFAILIGLGIIYYYALFK